MAFTIDFTGKVAVVTGAASGIGAGIAAALRQAGAIVEGCDITPAEGITVTDITDAAATTAYIQTIGARHGKIDILVSCAGANVFKGAADCTPAEWEGNLQLNLTAHWHLALQCKPFLEASGSGVIIIISSNHAFATIPGCFPYNIAKTALTGLVRSLAIEWSPSIRTIGLAPGFIDTPGNQQWFNSFPDPLAERNRTITMHPVKKLGTPAEIGAWCVFMSSEHAAFASGTTYLIDGGRSALLQEEG